MLGLSSDDWQAIAAIAQAIAALVALAATVAAFRSAKAAREAAQRAANGLKFARRSARASHRAAEAASVSQAPVIVGEYVKNAKGNVMASLKNAGNGAGTVSDATLCWSEGLGVRKQIVGRIVSPTLAPGWHTQVWFEHVPPPNLVPLEVRAQVELSARRFAGLDPVTVTTSTEFRWDHSVSWWRPVSEVGDPPGDHEPA